MEIRAKVPIVLISKPSSTRVTFRVDKISASGIPALIPSKKNYS